MPTIRYASPETVEGACSLLAEHGDSAAVLSGGQSLMPMIRQRLSSYEVLVDINDLGDWAYVEVDSDIRIGCLARHTDVAADAVRERAPVLAETAARIGDVQVRTRGTFCGAVAHADPAGDPPVLVTLLDAEVVATSTDGERTLAGSEFYHGFYETALDDDELVTEVRFPIPSEGTGAGYAKWEPTEGAYPVATVGTRLELEGGAVTDVSLVTGALEAGPTPMPDAADALLDREPTDEVLTEAAETLGEKTAPLGDFEGSAEFKQEISKTLAKEALETALERATREAGDT